MYAPGRRGRACQSCRRRKIKCGEQKPACQKCITSNIICPGPVTGPIIVEVNPQAGRRPYRQSDRKGKCLPTRDAVLPVDDPYERSDPEAEQLILNEFPDKFIIFNALATKLEDCTWVPHQRHSSLVTNIMECVVSGRFPKLRKAVAAVAMSMTGVATENWTLLHEGQKLYGCVLKTLLAEASRDMRERITVSRKQKAKPVSIEAIAVSSVCVWYEAISGTTDHTGWIGHACGAGRLALTRTPSDFTDGIAHEIFRTVRYSMANSCLVTICATPFALDEWINVPFSIHPKVPFDRLTDFMLVVTVCLDTVLELYVANTSVPGRVRVDDIRQKIMELDQQLNIWRVNFEESYTRDGQRGLYREIRADYEDELGNYHPANREYLSDHVYECVSHYGMLRLLVSLMNANLASPSELPVLREQAVNHSALAISAAAYADAHTTTGGLREYLNMVVPYLIVYWSTPSKSQKACAKTRILSWADPRGYRAVVGTEDGLQQRWSVLTDIWDHLG